MGWRSNTVAEGYIEESVENKVAISKKIFNNVLQSTSSKTNVPDDCVMTTEKNVITVLEDTISSNSDCKKDIGSVSTISSNGIAVAHAVKSECDMEKKFAFITSSNFHNCTINFHNN